MKIMPKTLKKMSTLYGMALLKITERLPVKRLLKIILNFIVVSRGDSKFKRLNQKRIQT